MSIILNKEFKTAFDLLENTDTNLFITGRAGTGKSTFLEYFKNHSSKNIIVLAPTGVAALNVKGQTIHSFFKFGTDITPSLAREKSYPKKLVTILENMDILVIDEISMVRSDLLDSVNIAMQEILKVPAPFGGKQVLFIGDLFQLPPVTNREEFNVLREAGYTTHQFFGAKVVNDSRFRLKMINFKEIFRQKDQTFIKILNRVRIGKLSEDDLKILNTRVKQIKDIKDYIYLTGTNRKVLKINNSRLNSIKTQLYTFKASFSSNFKLKQSPADIELNVKKGAQVMLLTNKKGQWVNGSIGTIIKINKSESIPNYVDLSLIPEGEFPEIIIRLTNGNKVSVTPFTWEKYEYKFDKKTKRIYSESIGKFIQYPIKLAWAITIHKSQGKTFNNVIIDLSSGIFAPGQLYVALSRSTSLDGIILTSPIKAKYAWTDKEILDFYRKMHNRSN